MYRDKSELTNGDSKFTMVYMAANEGVGQNVAIDESVIEDHPSDDEVDDCSESKMFYNVPMSFVIHTYSRVRPDLTTESSQTLSTQFSPYRHKVTMFKVFECYC